MNRKWWKILLGSVAVLYLFTVGNVSTDAAAGTVTEKNGAVILEYTEIGTYRVKDAYKAPNAPSGYFGYVFAGWYTDKDLTTPLNAECDNTNAAITNSENKYYAKFVPKEILGVRVQVLAGTTYEKETTDVRFITTVDSGNYNLVGFDVELNGITYNGESNRVCKKLYVVNKEEILEDYLPQNVFHEMSKYFLACKLTDVKHADYGDLMKIRPYWVTLDGTKVYGDTVNKTVNQAYTSSTASVTATQLATFARDTSVDNSSCYAQGGCTDGTYYYQAFVYQRDSAQNDDTNDCVYIGKYTLVDGNENNRLIVQSENLDLHHANDMTYNKDLTYTGDEKKSGLLVICHNAPCYDRVSFVDPDTLEIVNPNGITDLSDNQIEWKGTLNEQYIQLEEGRRIFAIEYNSALKQYVVGISGGQTFRILAADFSDVYGKAFEPINNELANFTRQGVGADDKYIYFVLHNGTKDSYNGHDGHVITVYDWQGNAVKVINIVTDNGINVNEEPENISIYDNVFYVGVGGSNSLKLYQLNRHGWSTEIIPENEAYIGSPEDKEYYTTLEEAVQKVEAGETITIVAENVEIDSAMSIKVSNVTIKNETDKNVVIKRSSDYVGPVFENGAENLVITRNTSGSLMFAGNNYAGQSYVKNISGGTMSLKELTFKNIETTESGAAVCATSGTVTIDTCEFKNNIARTNGGALCIEKQANAVVTNSKFITNKTINQMGGAIYNYSNDGIVITDCTFDGNSAAGNGGAIYHANGGKITLNNSDDDAIASIFQDNVSNGNGGAICIGSGTLDVTGYEFLGNSANRGGAVRLNKNNTITATFNGSVFKKNTAPINGGAISNASTVVCEENEAALTVLNCVFGAENEGNSSKIGGAIHNESSKITVTSSQFIENKSQNATTDNTTGKGGGAVNIVANSEAKFDGAGTFISNSTDQWGGAIYMTDSKLEISEYTFDQNSASYAGAVFVDNAKADDAGETTEVEINDAVFTRNTATDDGGVSYVNGRKVTFTDCKFGGTDAQGVSLGNTSSQYGGVIGINNSAVISFVGTEATKAVMEGNKATNHGGAIYVRGGSLKVSGYRFVNNHSNANGGAIYSAAYAIEVAVTNSTFEKNQATNNGGAIYTASTMATDDKYALSVTGCTFGGTGTAEDAYALGNKANQGGAIWHVTGNVKGENCNFISNKASDRGGALYVSGGGTISFEKGEFERNGADVTGGAILKSGNVALTITGMQFIGNTNKNGTIRNASGANPILNGCTLGENQTKLGNVTINQ